MEPRKKSGYADEQSPSLKHQEEEQRCTSYTQADGPRALLSTFFESRLDIRYWRLVLSNGRYSSCVR
jgi:hypothetical protein